MQRSFLEATKALGYKVIYGKNEVYFYNPYNQGEIAKKNVPSEHINQLRKALEWKDLKGLSYSMDTIKQYIIESHLPVFVVKAVSYNMIFEILRTMQQNAPIVIKTKMMDLLSQLDDVVLEDFIHALYGICEEYMYRLKEKDECSLEDMLDYIKNNYRDVNFSVELMASYFKTSTTSLSQTFKQLAGENISQHVIILRFKKAKELLKNTELSVKNISQEVGYYHVSSFIRRFKNVEGITPGEFRKECS